jgi:hypothetical protein
VAALAERWGVDEPTAVGFLEAFRRRGLAECHRGRWRATELARTRFYWFVGFEDETDEATL